MPGPASQIVGPGPNDRDLLEPDNPLSNLINSGVGSAMSLFGYTTTRRGHQGNGDATGRAAGDNSFYRDNADWMPGWGNTFGLNSIDPNQHPSGATAQDRATNYVGHDDPTGIWTDVRANLVTNESAAIEQARANGDTNISFVDVYDAHVNAYGDAQDGGKDRNPAIDSSNPFIDPASFALAVYGAPLMEHAGINAGPITGASIDLFNDPTDSAGEGWSKRMALSAGEMGAGVGAALYGGATRNPLAAMAGVGLMSLGAFSALYNTVTAAGAGIESTYDDLFNTD